MIDINTKDKDGHTAFYEACFNTDLKMMEFLLSKGADASIKYGEGEETILDMFKNWVIQINRHPRGKYRNSKEKIEKAIELLKRYGVER